MLCYAQMGPFVGEGTEIRDLSVEVSTSSYYPANYIPFAYTVSSKADAALFSPVGSQSGGPSTTDALAVKAGRGIMFRGRMAALPAASGTAHALR